ncbi:MAG: HEAT repeat domain-containing protein [bacterium]
MDARRRVAEMGPDAIPFLRDALEHGDPELRRWSVATLADLSQRVEEAVPVLSLVLDDSDAEVRDEALHGFLAAASRRDSAGWADHAR